MADDRIESIILLTAIEKEFTTVTGYLTKLKTDLASVPPLKNLIENANAPKDLAAATEKLATAQKNVAAAQQTVINGQGKLAQMQQAYDGTIKSLNANLDANIKKLNDSKASLKDIAEAQKKLTKEVEAGAISADEYRLKYTKLSDAALKYKQRVSDLNAELKDQIKLQFAAPGSIKEARVQNAQLTRARDNTQDPEKIKELNTLIDKNNKLIDDNSDALGRQKINIGNYQGAANSIVDALGKQEAKLQNLGSAYTSFGSQIATQKNIISGFAGNINSPEYKKATDKLKILEEGYKNTGIEVAKTRTVVDGFRRVAAVSTQDFTTAAAAQKALSTEAKNIGVAFGTNSEVFKEVNKVVGSSSQEFDKVSKAVDASGKNANTAGGLFKKAFGGLRTLANIIPGIGISGLLLFAIEPIMNWLTAVKEATGDAKLLKDTFAEGAKNAAQESAQIEVLRAKLTDLSKPAADRNLLRLEYNKIAADGNKIGEAELDNLIKINGQIDKQIGLIEKQALAKAAQSTISTFAQKSIDAEFEFQAALQQTGITEDKVSKSIDNRIKKQDLLQKKQNSSLDGFKNNAIVDPKFSEKTQSVDFVDAKLEGLLIRKKSAALELNRVIKLLLPSISDDGVISKDKAAKTDGSLSAIKEKKDTAFEQDKVRLERQLRLLDADIKDEKTYYLDKLTLLEEYGVKSKELLEKQAAEDIKNKNAEKDREVANLNDSKKGKSGSQIKRIDQNIAIVEKNTTNEIELINVKLVDDLLKNDERRLAGRKDILKAQLKVEEEFAKDRIDLEEVQNKIIDKIRKKQISEELKDEKERADKKIKLEKDITDTKKRLQQEAVETIKAFVTDGFDKEIMGLDNRKRLLDEDTARRINQINLLGLTEAERTRQTAIVQKEANFQNEQIEKRKRQIALERAKFEKAASIASIIANTAKAIVESLPNIPLSLLVGGIGLLQLTRAISTPLPRYKDGRGKGKDELAIVGDGGKHEYIMRGNGLIEQTPRTDTLTRLMPNDVVFKDNNALLNAMLSASNPYSQIKNIKPNNNDGFSRNDINKLIRAVEKERMPKISIHNSIPIESTAYYQHHIKN